MTHGPSTRWPVRPARADDIDVLAAWLPPGADTRLPLDGGDAWLVADRPAGSNDRQVGATAGVVAALRVRRAIGMARPRHWYHVGCVVHAAPELDLFHRQTTLLLGNDHTGASELADLVCDATLSQAQQAGVMGALLQAALRHLAAERPHHAGPLIVELPGLHDDQGRSAFWQGLGRHFFGGDLITVARQHGPHWPGLVAALLPRQPVYVAFLAEAAQAALAQAAPAARVWMDTLAHQGFRYSHHVTIIDGGPVFEAHLDSLLPALPID